MLKASKRKLILFLIMLLLGAPLLTGCGFHLRGAYNAAPLQMNVLEISPFSPEDRFQQKLVQLLNAHEVKIQKGAKCLFEYHTFQETSPVAYGRNGELVREKIKLTLVYTLKKDGNILLEREVWAERHHHLNMNYELATAQERDMIVKDMQADVLKQLMLQLRTVSFS